MAMWQGMYFQSEVVPAPVHVTRLVMLPMVAFQRLVVVCIAAPVE